MKKIILLMGLIICFSGCGNREIENNTEIENEVKEAISINLQSENDVLQNTEDNEDIVEEKNEEDTNKANKEKDIQKKDNDALSNKVQEKEEAVEKNVVKSVDDIELKVQEQEIIYENGVEVGNRAIDFEVELLSGEKVKLSNYLGKPIFLNFWATWCGPCIGEMPDIEKIKNEYGDKLEVLLINGGESKEDVEMFLNRKGYSFNVGLDEKGEVLTKYDSMYIPLSVFIDKNGIIVERKVGSMTYNSMKETVDNLIK